ncbi:hypothetical protein WMY93_012536 [Mugilogobius chulae]|uniref:G domain-containing protein n=1 Tax=Mugilogobius chulae TaxID=88201 RepID=A0AAW0P5P5_9GOBI
MLPGFEPQSRASSLSVRPAELCERRLPYSLHRGAPLSHGRLQSLSTRPQRHSCTVDPRLNEEFVFVDCVEPNQDAEQDVTGVGPMPPDLVTPRDSVTPAHRKKRGLERQLKALKTIMKQQQEQIHFHDSPAESGEDPSPDLDLDPSAGFSSMPCSGCGALLQTVDPVVPGIFTSTPLQDLQNQDQDQEQSKERSRTKPREILHPSPRTSHQSQTSKPKISHCQRCHLLTHHQQMLEVTLNQDHFKQIVAVVGTKLDLLPVLTSVDVSSVKKRLQDYIQTQTGFEPLSVNLVSAKTGFGIEELVSGLHRVWRHKGDVVLVGSANAGKSTLFNALLESDYNRLSGSKRATESPWPGHVGRTFKKVSRPEVIHFEPDELAFGETEDGLMTRPVAKNLIEELPSHHAKDAHWLYDTPGILKDQDVIAHVCCGLK